MTFEQAVAFLFEQEGGYVNDPSDPGGVTKFGISKRSYPGVDIDALTKEGAAEIYKRDYWDICRCEELPHGLDLLVFDTAVNQGAATSIKLLQRALNVTDDGIMGRGTLAAANHAVNGIEEFLARRMFQYAINPQVHRFGLGWYRRVSKGARLAMEPPTI